MVISLTLLKFQKRAHLDIGVRFAVDARVSEGSPGGLW